MYSINISLGVASANNLWMFEFQGKSNGTAEWGKLFALLLFEHEQLVSFGFSSHLQTDFEFWVSAKLFKLMSFKTSLSSSTYLFHLYYVQFE